MNFKSRKLGFILILGVYILATVIGIYVFSVFDQLSFLIRLLVADIVATIIVWLFGLLFKNSSVYDPYWSVAPIIILFGFTYYLNVIDNSTVRLLLLAIVIWGIRLTYNWATTFQNMKTQDWRYEQYKENFPKWWFIINLFGINMMPTLIVFIALIPGFYLIIYPQSANTLTVLAFFICVLAAFIQFIADKQLHNFKEKNKLSSKRVCNEGLWGLCRHPNYFGEILMWCGVYGILISVNIEFYKAGIGAFLMALLFLFISIPLMEKRQLSNKPEYREYTENTNMIIPFKSDFYKVFSKHSNTTKG